MVKTMEASRRIMVRVSEIKRENNESKNPTLFTIKAWDDDANDDDSSDSTLVYYVLDRRLRTSIWTVSLNPPNDLMP